MKKWILAALVGWAIAIVFPPQALLSVVRGR
jgi:hypothetical protein